MSKLYLKSQPSLKDFQAYIKQMVKERGFEDETAQKIILLFIEEVGELARAIRKIEGLKIDKSQRQHDVREELADCLIYLLDLANYFNIDLEEAFRKKEEINKKRKWGRYKTP